MAIPAGVETVTVTDGGVPLTGPDGSPLEGHFTVVGPDIATVKEDDFLFGGGARRWVRAGRFDPLPLVATDATGIDPTGFTYTVVFTPKYGTAWTRYLSLPKASPSVVLADVVIPDPVAGSYAVLADSTGLLSRSANLDDLADKTAARSNLGLGGAAVADVGAVEGTVAAGDDARLSDARTPVPHAASHAADGGDPLTVAISQVAGLAASLAERLLLAGGTLTGGLILDGANLTVQREDGEGAYRLRVTGGGLDFEIGGQDVTVSVWDGADFTGVQHTVMRWEPAGPHLIGRTQYGTGPFDTVHDIDAGTGVASLGAKNGLANLRLAGFKNTPGAPGGGGWTTGDLVLDSAGSWHLCTAGGTPGTWT